MNKGHDKRQMSDRDVMKLALENICGAILCEINPMSSRKEMLRLMDEAIAALHQALEQPEQEPVAYLYKYRDGWTSQLRFDGSKPMEVKKLYTAPPKREWVGLTDEEIQEFGYAAEKFDASNSEWFDRWGFARAIEAKLKEKNRE